MSGDPVTLQSKPDAKITLHWLNKSRAQRILWLFEELDVPYELKTYERGPDGLAGPELKQVHPLGKSPAVTVQSADGNSSRTIVESGPIVEYITEYFGKHLIPQRWEPGKENKIAGETEDWLRYRHFMHYAEGSLMTLLIVALTTNRIKDAPVPFFIKPITRGIASKVESSFLNGQFATHYAFLEEQLSTSGGDYLCGSNLTGADILMSFPLEAAKERAGLTKDKYPKCVAYVDRLLERDAYKRAMERIKKETGKYESVNDL